MCRTRQNIIFFLQKTAKYQAFFFRILNPPHSHNLMIWGLPFQPNLREPPVFAINMHGDYFVNSIILEKKGRKNRNFFSFVHFSLDFSVAPSRISAFFPLPS